VFKKLMLIVAMLALVLVVVVPALAQGNHHDRFDRFNNGEVSQEFNQDIDETGNVTLNTSVTSTGDNSNQCVAPLQFGNTGNLQNAQGFLQYNSTADDIEFEGSSFEFSPSLSNTCEQTVQQAAAAGGN
jgi:hypothetical protein